MAKRSKQNPQHYVDNKKLYEEMKLFKEKCKEAEGVGESRPPVPDYIGMCFLKIANGLSFRPNFINYTYRDEMISDGIENCLQYIYNFNPDKSKNPFAYFTQIIYYAFIRRIQKEKKQAHIVHKIIEKAEYRTFETMEGDTTPYSVQGFDADMMLPVVPILKSKEAEKKEKTPKSLENFMED